MTSPKQARERTIQVQEYQRCAHALTNESSGPKSHFLRFYALYLAGERRRQYAPPVVCRHPFAVPKTEHVTVAQITQSLLRSEEKIEVAGALGKVDVQNRVLDTLERDLEELHKCGQLDSFCLYVYGLVLADR